MISESHCAISNSRELDRSTYLYKTSNYQNCCDARDISLTTATQSCVVLLFLHQKAIFNRDAPTCFRLWRRRQYKR